MQCWGLSSSHLRVRRALQSGLGCHSPTRCVTGTSRFPSLILAPENGEHDSPTSQSWWEDRCTCSSGNSTRHREAPPGRWTLLSPTNQARQKPRGLLGACLSPRTRRHVLAGPALGHPVSALAPGLSPCRVATHPLVSLLRSKPPQALAIPGRVGHIVPSRDPRAWPALGTPLLASLRSWGSSRPLQLMGLMAARPAPWPVLLLEHCPAGHPPPSLCPNVTSWRSLLSPWPCLHLDAHILLSFNHSSCHPQQCSVCS